MLEGKKGENKLTRKLQELHCLWTYSCTNLVSVLTAEVICRA